MTYESQYSMCVRPHGGHCCGVKHIASFEGMRPKTILQDVTKARSRSDFPFGGASPGHNAYYPGYFIIHSGYSNTEVVLPEEPAAVRLLRLLDWCTSQWWAQRLEVTLIPRQRADWEPVLLDLGFKLVGGDPTRNSNTHNKIYTYWLVYDQKDENLKLPNMVETYGPKYGLKIEKEKKAPPKKAAPFQTIGADTIVS